MVSGMVIFLAHHRPNYKFDVLYSVVIGINLLIGHVAHDDSRHMLWFRLHLSSTLIFALHSFCMGAIGVCVAAYNL
jgi:hypothetical protein